MYADTAMQVISIDDPFVMSNSHHNYEHHSFGMLSKSDALADLRALSPSSSSSSCMKPSSSSLLSSSASSSSTSSTTALLNHSSSTSYGMTHSNSNTTSNHIHRRGLSDHDLIPYLLQQPPSLISHLFVLHGEKILSLLPFAKLKDMVETVQRVSNLLKLPDSLLCFIFSLLATSDILVHLRSVSMKFFRLTYTSKLIWQNRSIKYPYPYQISFEKFRSIWHVGTIPIAKRIEIYRIDPECIINTLASHISITALSSNSATYTHTHASEVKEKDIKEADRMQMDHYKSQNPNLPFAGRINQELMEELNSQLWNLASSSSSSPTLPFRSSSYEHHRSYSSESKRHTVTCRCNLHQTENLTISIDPHHHLTAEKYEKYTEHVAISVQHLASISTLRSFNFVTDGRSRNKLNVTLPLFYHLALTPLPNLESLNIEYDDHIAHNSSMTPQSTHHTNTLSSLSVVDVLSAMIFAHRKTLKCLTLQVLIEKKDDEQNEDSTLPSIPLMIVLPSLSLHSLSIVTKPLFGLSSSQSSSIQEDGEAYWQKQWPSIHFKDAMPASSMELEKLMNNYYVNHMKVTPINQYTQSPWMLEHAPLFTSLKSFTLKDNDLPTPFFVFAHFLQSCHLLEKLSLKLSLEDSYLQKFFSFSFFPKLSHLNIKNTKMTAKALNAFIHLPALQEVTLKFSPNGLSSSNSFNSLTPSITSSAAAPSSSSSSIGIGAALQSIVYPRTLHIFNEKRQTLKRMYFEGAYDKEEWIWLKRQIPFTSIYCDGNEVISNFQQSEEEDLEERKSIDE